MSVARQMRHTDGHSGLCWRSTLPGTLALSDHRLSEHGLPITGEPQRLVVHVERAAWLAADDTVHSDAAGGQVRGDAVVLAVIPRGMHHHLATLLTEGAHGVHGTRHRLSVDVRCKRLWQIG